MQGGAFLAELDEMVVEDRKIFAIFQRGDEFQLSGGPVSIVNGAKLPVILLQEVPKSQPSVRGPGETLDFRAEVYAAFRDAARAMKDFPVRRRVSVSCQQTYLFLMVDNNRTMSLLGDECQFVYLLGRNGNSSICTYP